MDSFDSHGISRWFLLIKSVLMLMNMTGVIKTTERSNKKTQRIAVLVPLITESLVKSSQMISDYGKEEVNNHLFICNLSMLLT